MNGNFSTVLAWLSYGVLDFFVALAAGCLQLAQRDSILTVGDTAEGLVHTPLADIPDANQVLLLAAMLLLHLTKVIAIEPR